MNKYWAIWLIFLPQLLFSQADPLPIKKESYRAYIGLSTGATFPFGAFKDVELDIINGGYARTGYSFNLDYGYRFYKNLIIAGNYSRITNPLDETALQKQSVSSCANCNKPKRFDKAEASPYELNAFYGGIGFIKEQPNLSFQMQFMVGYGNMFTSNIEMSTDTSRLVFKTKRKSNLTYAVGAGLRIHLTDQLDFSTFGSFLLYQANIDQEIEYEGVTNYVRAPIQYQVFNLSFGLAYRLIKKEDESEYKLKY